MIVNVICRLIESCKLSFLCSPLEVCAFNVLGPSVLQEILRKTGFPDDRFGSILTEYKLQDCIRVA